MVSMGGWLRHGHRESELSFRKALRRALHQESALQEQTKENDSPGHEGESRQSSRGVSRREVSGAEEFRENRSGRAGEDKGGKVTQGSV